MIKAIGLIWILLFLFSANAQDPCKDDAGRTRMEDEFDHYFAQKTDVEARKKAFDSGKAYLEKYGTCPSAKERADWLRSWFARISNVDPIRPDTNFVRAFDAALKAKDWNTLFSTGPELLKHYPEDYRPVEIILGTAGYDELLRGDTRWEDKTLTYAKLSIADLDAGKEFRIQDQPKDYYGITPFAYKSREDATAWMNLIAGTIYVLAKNDLSAAVPYLYRATLAPDTSDVARNPKPYEMIGDFYLDQLKRKGETSRADQMADQAMIAFAHAFTLSTKVEQPNSIRQKFMAAYRLRWKQAEPQSVDELIRKSSVGKLIDPSSLLDPKGEH